MNFPFLARIATCGAILYFASFSANAFTLTPPEEVVLKKAVISISLKEASLIDSLNNLSKAFSEVNDSNYNFRIALTLSALNSPSAKRKATMTLSNISTYNALSKICSVFGFQFTIQGDCVLLSPVTKSEHDAAANP
jgi:hypothetical protein